MSEWSLFGGCIFLMSVALVILLYPLRRIIINALLLAPILACFVFIGYWNWGSWPDWITYRHQQVKLKQAQDILASVGSSQKLIDKLTAHLKEQPGSSRGWYLLGKLYASQGNWESARDAYARAHQLKPADAETAVHYAHSLWQLNHRHFNKEIREFYKSILEQNANQPDALAMLAMDAFARHAYQQAIDYWQHLLKIVPPQTEEARAIHKAIVKAQQKMT